MLHEKKNYLYSFYYIAENLFAPAAIRLLEIPNEMVFGTDIFIPRFKKREHFFWFFENI